MFRIGNSSEKTARIIYSLRGSYKLKDILAVTGFPKSTYMYWQKHFDRKNPTVDLEQGILEIRKENKVFQSMSLKGNCYDNSVMESFFRIMKQEMYYGVVYYSYEELSETIGKYIKYYNEKQIKENLGWMSPVEYRLSLLVA